MQSRTAKCAQVCGVNTVCFASCQCGYGVHRYENETRPNMALFSSLVTLNDSLHARIFLTLLPLPPPSRPDTEIKCQAYAKFPAGVTGGPNDPCTPAADFQLSAKSDPVCSLMCAPGYEQKGGDGISTLKCGVDGKLTGGLNCTGLACAHICHLVTPELVGPDHSRIHEGPLQPHCSSRHSLILMCPTFHDGCCGCVSPTENIVPTHDLRVTPHLH